MKTQIKNNKTKILKKRLTSWRPMVLSRHPSHSILRAKNKTLPLLPTQSVIRLGSSTELPDTVAKGGRRMEINSVEAIKNSASKLRMKQCFSKAGVKTADWFIWKEEDTFIMENTEINVAQLLNENKGGFVMKLNMGSRGRGMQLIKNLEDWDKFKRNHL